MDKNKFFKTLLPPVIHYLHISSDQILGKTLRDRGEMLGRLETGMQQKVILKDRKTIEEVTEIHRAIIGTSEVEETIYVKIS